MSLEPFRAAIVGAFPQLAGSTFRVLAEGWHSTAVEVDGRLIFKFPKDAAAEKALVREARLLRLVRDRLVVAIPDLRIHEGPPVFSSHEKLPGEHLLTSGYMALSDGARERLGANLAHFYATLHETALDEAAAAGAGPVEAWQSPDEVRSKALPTLPSELRGRAEEITRRFECLGPDPCGTTYGFFDGHGWNMAFDHRRGRLNGIYDFADSGLGPLHQDFIYSNFISADLTERIIGAYEAETGRSLDRWRIAILTGMHRLSELSEHADDPVHRPAMVGHVVEWITTGDPRHQFVSC